jgi:nucleotide-binding universal stress UspA family protein
MSVPAAAQPAAERHAFRTVLLATDLTSASADATARAIDLAAGLGARLLVVSVVDTRRRAGVGAPRMDTERGDREAGLLEVVRTARAAGVSAEYLVWAGEPGSSLVSIVEAEDADVLVVGTRGRSGPERMLLGSVSDHVVHHARCPVLVVRPERSH